MKIFDEILVNARDHSINDPGCDTIKVEYNKEEGYISVFNNGSKPIPVEEHPIHKVLVPSMIFGEMLSGSNFDDTKKEQQVVKWLWCQVSKYLFKRIFSGNSWYR